MAADDLAIPGASASAAMGFISMLFSRTNQSSAQSGITFILSTIALKAQAQLWKTQFYKVYALV